MYGPPPDCKRFEVDERTVRVNVSGLLVENVLRALDDDTRVPVLINPSVTRDAFSPSGFPARHWAVLLVLFSPQQTLVELSLTSVVVAHAPILRPSSDRTTHPSYFAAPQFRGRVVCGDRQQFMS